MSRILIIEDEAGIARFVELELKHEGNEVEKAADGREVIYKCENGTVYTVEGNSGDACKQRQYTVGSSNIYGYGIPAY